MQSTTAVTAHLVAHDQPRESSKILRGYLLSARQPLRTAVESLLALPLLAAAILILEPGPLDQWPAPDECYAAIADVRSLWLVAIGLSFGVSVGRILRAPSAIWFGRRRCLNQMASPFGSPKIVRDATPATAVLDNPIWSRRDVLDLVWDSSLTQALLLVVFAVLAPPIVAAALVLAAAPVLLERAVVAAQLLGGLRQRWSAHSDEYDHRAGVSKQAREEAVGSVRARLAVEDDRRRVL